MSTTPTPVALVILSSLLLTCNVLWLYSSSSYNHRVACSHEGEIWSPAGNTSTSHRHDYQNVVGSGLSDVPFPIPIPNDTVLLSEDLIDEFIERQPRYLTIGISSVWRKEDYLSKTIDSILRESTPEEREEFHIFLLLADADFNLRSQRAGALAIKYPEEIGSGLLRILQPPASLYPSIDFTAIRRTYNDPVARVQWRTKQVLDFAFLYWYTWSVRSSTFYLVLEDDVLSAKHFVSAIKDFVALHKDHHWVSLQLAGFLGIGQLLRCEDLDRLVSFLLLFYREHPVDVLLNHWVSLMAPEKPAKDRPTRRVPGLFQHFGVHSTLANKTQALKDNTFSLVKRLYWHQNPPADVVTTIRQYKAYVAEHAYSSAPGMFWGIPKPGDTYDMVFPQPLPLARVVVITGAALTKKKHIRDRLASGWLELSGEFSAMENPKRATCNNFQVVQDVSNGEIHATDIQKVFPGGVQCVRIQVGPKQKSWLAISEIAIFTIEDQQMKTNPGDHRSSDDILVVDDSGGEKEKSVLNRKRELEKGVGGFTANGGGGEEGNIQQKKSLAVKSEPKKREATLDISAPVGSHLNPRVKNKILQYRDSYKKFLPKEVLTTFNQKL